MLFRPLQRTCRPNFALFLGGRGGGGGGRDQFKITEDLIVRVWGNSLNAKYLAKRSSSSGTEITCRKSLRVNYNYWRRLKCWQLDRGLRHYQYFSQSFIIIIVNLQWLRGRGGGRGRNEVVDASSNKAIIISIIIITARPSEPILCFTGNLEKLSYLHKKRNFIAFWQIN